MVPTVRSASTQYLYPFARLSLAKAFSKSGFYFCLFLLLYMLTPTANYFWDGITFALQIEKVANQHTNFDLLFHQNHLLYNALGYLVYYLVFAIGIKIKVLYLLQFINMIIAACGVATLYSIIKPLTNNYIAAVTATFFGTTATWWKLSTDADAYILSVVLLILCLKNLLGELPNSVLSGILFALAMLIHELSSLFFFAGLAIIFTHPHIEKKLKFSLTFSTLSVGLTISVYYLVAITMHGITSPGELIEWVTTNPSMITPENNPIPGIWMTPNSNLRLIVGHSFKLFLAKSTGLALGTAIITGIVGIVLAAKMFQSSGLAGCWKIIRHFPKRLVGDERRLFIIITFWIIPYLIFLLFFEPMDENLRLFYLPAIALALALVLKPNQSQPANSNATFPLRYKDLRVAALSVSLLALFNTAFFILPNHHPEANPLIAEARNTAAIWHKNAIIYFADREEVDTTFQYFNDQPLWKKMPKGSFAKIITEIDQAILNGKEVWLNKGAIKDADQLFEHYESGDHLEVVADYAWGKYIRLIPKPLTP
ncbi:MAG: hypothetical protein AB1757_15800 [Acidobacteriota bacterium]